MFALNIALGNVAWRLLFKEEQRAQAACVQMRDEFINIDDDFGQFFRARQTSIHGFMLEDMSKTKQAHVELFLHQKRTENMAMVAAQADPALKAAARMNGPAMIDPMGGMMRSQ